VLPTGQHLAVLHQNVQDAGPPLGAVRRAQPIPERIPGAVKQVPGKRENYPGAVNSVLMGVLYFNENPMDGIYERLFLPMGSHHKGLEILGFI
jgi:hypothetical protein